MTADIEQALAEALDMAWPGHTEGSGYSSSTEYTVAPPETLYWVKDLCLPSPRLAASILATEPMQAVAATVAAQERARLRRLLSTYYRKHSVFGPPTAVLNLLLDDYAHLQEWTDD